MKLVGLTDLGGDAIHIAPKHLVAVIANMAGFDTRQGGCILIMTEMRFVVRETRTVVLERLAAISE